MQCSWAMPRSGTFSVQLAKYTVRHSEWKHVVRAFENNFQRARLSGPVHVHIVSGHQTSFVRFRDTSFGKDILEEFTAAGPVCIIWFQGCQCVWCGGESYTSQKTSFRRWYSRIDKQSVYKHRSVPNRGFGGHHGICTAWSSSASWCGWWSE